MRFTPLRTILAGLLLLLPLYSLAQSPDVGSKKGVKIRFHVTSVSYAEDPDWCPIAQCYAKKYTVEGFVDSSTGTRTAYRLTCEEVQSMKPRPVVTISCGSVHANYDYDARLLASGINFWPDGTWTQPPPYHAVYDIVSEKEVTAPPR